VTLPLLLLLPGRSLACPAALQKGPQACQTLLLLRRQLLLLLCWLVGQGS
jgi:hypothetical protein